MMMMMMMIMMMMMMMNMHLPEQEGACVVLRPNSLGTVDVTHDAEHVRWRQVLVVDAGAGLVYRRMG